jgi:hypothetical protein
VSALQQGQVPWDWPQGYTMLTLNADEHPLMSWMHKPDPKLGPTEPDKQTVALIELEHVDQWLFGTVDQAAGVVRVPRVEVMGAAAVTQVHPATANEPLR